MKMSRRKWLVIAGVSIAVVIGVKLASSRLVAGLTDASSQMAAKAEAKEKAAPDPITITVEKVQARPIRRTITAVGSLYGWEEVPITPKVEGRVVRVHKYVGDIVKPGDVLAEIDPTDFQLAVNEAERGLELELARLNLSVPPSADFSVTALPSLVRAEALERQARARATRLKNGPRTSITDEEIQQADTDVDVARANLRQAELEARATLASVRHREATLKTAKQRLADTRIVAPQPNPPGDPGVPLATEYLIAYRKIAAGETVRIIPLADAPPLFRLVIDRPLKLQLTLPERHLAEVAMGQSVDIDVDAFAGEKFVGKVSRVNRTVERLSRTFSIEVMVPNLDRRLSAGSFVKAVIVTKPEDTTRTIPEEAVVQFAGVMKVFVFENDKVREVIIKPGVPIVVVEGNRKRTWLAVDADLPEGTSVVTSGQTRLANGMAARLR